MASETLCHRVGDDRLGRTPAEPRLEPPAASRRVRPGVLDHGGDEFMAALMIDTIAFGKLPHVVNENRTLWVSRRAALFQPVEARRVHIDEVHTGLEPSIVGLFRHQHGIRQVPIMLEIHRHLDAIVRAREQRSGREQCGYERGWNEQPHLPYVVVSHGFLLSLMLRHAATYAGARAPGRR